MAPDLFIRNIISYCAVVLNLQILLHIFSSIFLLLPFFFYTLSSSFSAICVTLVFLPVHYLMSFNNRMTTLPQKNWYQFEKFDLFELHVNLIFFRHFHFWHQLLSQYAPLFYFISFLHSLKYGFPYSSFFLFSLLSVKPSCLTNSCVWPSVEVSGTALLGSFIWPDLTWPDSIKSNQMQSWFIEADWISSIERNGIKMATFVSICLLISRHNVSDQWLSNSFQDLRWKIFATYGAIQYRTVPYNSTTVCNLSAEDKIIVF